MYRPETVGSLAVVQQAVLQGTGMDRSPDDGET